MTAAEAEKIRVKDLQDSSYYRMLNSRRNQFDDKPTESRTADGFKPLTVSARLAAGYTPKAITTETRDKAIDGIKKIAAEHVAGKHFDPIAGRYVTDEEVKAVTQKNAQAYKNDSDEESPETKPEEEKVNTPNPFDGLTFFDFFGKEADMIKAMDKIRSKDPHRVFMSSLWSDGDGYLFATDGNILMRLKMANHAGFNLPEGHYEISKKERGIVTLIASRIDGQFPNVHRLIDGFTDDMADRQKVERFEVFANQKVTGQNAKKRAAAQFHSDCLHMAASGKAKTWLSIYHVSALPVRGYSIYVNAELNTRGVVFESDEKDFLSVVMPYMHDGE